MPPTTNWDPQDTDSELANHERDMLNKMVELIRLKTIDQIMTQTGRRPKHFDSVTGGTFSVIGLLEGLPSPPDQDTYSTGGDLGKFISSIA
jgi:hypothetical protein